MKKIFLICMICVVAGKLLSAQQKLPVVHSNTKDVIIKYNRDTTNWLLIPETKPDVFTVGSSLKEKKVQFITNVDSISYNVQAGRKYDFIILLNNKVSCYTQIAALSDPILLNKAIGSPVLVFVSLLFLFVYRERKRIAVVHLLRFGIIAPLAFWVITIVAGFLHGNYNHFRMTVSELGTIGTRSEVFMSVATLLLAVFSMLFSIGFYKASKKMNVSPVPAALSVAISISFAWAAVFPSGHELHGSLGSLPLFMLMGTLLLVIVWKREKKYLTVKVFSVASLVIMMLFTLRFIPTFQQNFEGLIQRFLWTGWSVWYVSLNIQLERLLEPKKYSIPM